MSIFVEHEDGVLGAGLLHRLDDLAGQGADVGAAMAADLGLVAHAAERHADELAAGGLGDGHAERGLADARRPDEAEDGALGILDELADGEEFEDAVLDLFQAVVVFVEDLFGVVDGADFLGLLLPRHGEQPVEVVARDGGLGGHGRHGFELLELLDGLFDDVLGHAGGLDLLLQLVELGLFAAAELLLDGLDLLVEVVLFLRALHLALDARLDGAVHVQLFDLDVEHVGDAGEAIGGIEDVEELLLFVDGELEVGGDGVGQLGGLVHADGGDHGLVVQRLLELDVLLEERGDALHELLDLRRHLEQGLAGADGGDEEAVGVVHLDGAGALDAFDEHLDVAVGHLDALDDVADGAGGVDVSGVGLVDGGVMLGGEEDLAVAGQGLFEGADAGFAADDEGRHHVGEDDHVADRHHGQLAQFIPVGVSLGVVIVLPFVLHIG